VVDSFDEDHETIESHTEVFLPGQMVDFDIIEKLGNLVNVQFANGSVAFNINTDWFKEKETNQ